MASVITGKSVGEASLALLVLVVVQAVVAAWSARSERGQAFFDSGPVVLVEHGTRRHEAMQRARVSPASSQQSLRAAGVTDVFAVKLAVMGGLTAEERYGIPETLKFIFGGGDTGARAPSPGVDDPVTAMDVIDRSGWCGPRPPSAGCSTACSR